MSVNDLSTSTQNYLKVIWSLTEWSAEPVTATLISRQTGLRISSVSDAMRKLGSQGLISHAPYGSVELTDEGRTYAVAMIRRHRLIETFLVDALGYTWDQVHDEAENMEHAVSDFFVARLDEFLGHPERDPHGDPIPAADGTVPALDARSLTDLAAAMEKGTEKLRVTVERISDSDPELLKHFEENGIVVGAVLTVTEGAPFSEALEVTVDKASQAVPLGNIATDALFVSTASPTSA